METKKIRVIRFKQNKTELLSLVLPFALINQLSEVKIYGEDDGYQRKPNKIHYNKVKNYILNSIDDFKFPTSIILGTDNEVITEKYLKEDNCGEYLDLSNVIENKIFRIVDGQHRLEGLNLASKHNCSINNFLLPVLIIISKENKKSNELEIFTTINSTSKRISIDLAELAKHSYQLKEQKVNEKEVVKFITIETAYNLKSNNEQSIWNNAIKFDIHSDITLGIVGVTMFTESITPIVEKFIDRKIVKRLIEGEEMNELIKYCQESAKTLSMELDKVWNLLIRKKWKDCFKEEIVKNDENDLVTIYYSKNYYIQQTLGVKALNIIYSECYKGSKSFEESYDRFKKIIDNSSITANDWKKGSLFSGLSSESGFNKVRKLIKGETI